MKKQTIFFQLNNVCNLNCKFCSERTSSRISPKELDYQLVKDTISQFSVLGGKRVKFSGGEPTLYKDLYSLVNHSIEYGLSANIITNAQILLKNRDFVSDPSQVRIRVSLEGRQPLNDSIRGKGSYEKAFHNIIEYKKMGFKSNIKLTLTPDTEQEDIIELARFTAKQGLEVLQIGIVLYFGAAQKESFKFSVNKFEELLKPIPSLVKETGIKIALSDYVPFVPKYKDYYDKACKAVTGLFVFVDGRVVPCRFLENINLGNLYDNTITEIIERDKTFDNIKLSNKCLNCEFINNCGGGDKYRSLKYKHNLSESDPACFFCRKSAFLPL